MKIFEVALVRTNVLEGGRDINLNELLEYYHSNKFKAFQIRMAKYIGEILLILGEEHFSDAEDWIKTAIKIAQENGMMWYLGRDYALYGDLFKRKGDQSKSREKFAKAIDVMKGCGANGWVEKYEKELASLS